VTSGIFFTREAKPLMEPTIDGAPSVQMPTQFSQDRPFVSKYEDMILNISCPLLVSFRFLQQKKFSWISPSFTNLTNATTWLLLVKSVRLLSLDTETVIFQLITQNLFSIMWQVFRTPVNSTVWK
jgi:hypothetical protein